MLLKSLQSDAGIHGQSSCKMSSRSCAGERSLCVCLMSKFRPRVTQRYRPVEDERPFAGVGVHTEIAEPFELDAPPYGRPGDARLRSRVAQYFERLTIQ